MGLTPSKVIPHLLWNGEQLKAGDLDTTPLLTTEGTIMHHKSFRRTQTGTISHGSYYILTFADTGAQTCSRGPDKLKLFRCLEWYLVQTSHWICSIMDNQLDIKGVFMHIKIGLRDTTDGLCVKQHVWILFVIICPEGPTSITTRFPRSDIPSQLNGGH